MQENGTKNEMTIAGQAMLTADDIKAQVSAIQSVMKSVMKDQVHYGKIPGCGDKPALLKPGAEKIMATFRLGVEPEIIDLSGEDDKTFRVIAHAFHQPTGTKLGAGVGECSTNEEKYKWKGTYSDREFESTPENRRRIKFSTYKGATKEIKQIRTNPADLANTVLKMAKKRALVDMVLTVTAASDVFEQDLDEDHLASYVRDQKSDVAEPQAKDKGNAKGNGLFYTTTEKAIRYSG